MSWAEAAREQMVRQQVRAWDVLDPAVLDVLARMPRERFVPESHRSLAFADIAVPLPGGQHMLPPKIAGRILEILNLTGNESVLEIGTGSGFLTACLSRLAARVRSLEIRADLAARARQVLAQVQTGPIEVVQADAFADGSLAGDWDAIVLTGSLPVYDTRFERLLASGGRLFAIVGEAPLMAARVYTRGATGIVAKNVFETDIPALTNAPQPARFSF
jgi:protein-L-isoaspartate(D-aspartate) O-methyltransferase